MSTSPFRVTVVDDHTLFAESLVIALRHWAIDARSVGPSSPTTTSANLVRAILDTRPRVVLLDLDLGLVGDPMDLVSTLADEGGISVVGVTGSSDLARYGAALARGADAVIPTSASFRHVVETVERTRDGLSVMSESQRRQLLLAYREAAELDRDLRVRFSRITRREAEVLGQLMVGRQVTEIARTRFVSEATVRTQVKSILAKLQVSSQLTAVGLAHEVGWQPPACVGDDAAATAAAIRRRAITA